MSEITDIPISRKEAFKKAGKYAVFTAAVSMMILAPRKAVANPSAPGWGDPVGPPGGGTGSGTGVANPLQQSPFIKPSPEQPSGGLKSSPWQ